jgi:hypothetical protein
MTALRTSPLLCICWLANAFLILFACFMFLGALVVFGPWNGWPLFWRLVLLAWPFPQIAAFILSRRRSKEGRPEMALKISLLSVLLFGLADAVYIWWVFT